MSTFKNYYESMLRTYDFRIKSVGRLGDDEMDVIERVLDKYRPSKISKVDKMMFQTHPLGFAGVQNAEVYYIDVELTVPARSATLAYDLRQAFGLDGNSGLIQVEGANDDAGEDNEEKIENNSKETLLTQPENPEYETPVSEESFGDAYNKTFLSYVKKVEEERGLNAPVDAPHPITKWEDQPKDQNGDIDTANFNEYLGDKKTAEGDDLGQFKPSDRLPAPKEEK